jgi:hypothetical protein
MDSCEVGVGQGVRREDVSGEGAERLHLEGPHMHEGRRHSAEEAVRAHTPKAASPQSIQQEADLPCAPNQQPTLSTPGVGSTTYRGVEFMKGKWRARITISYSQVIHFVATSALRLAHLHCM